MQLKAQLEKRRRIFAVSRNQLTARTNGNRIMEKRSIPQVDAIAANPAAIRQ